MVANIGITTEDTALRIRGQGVPLPTPPLTMKKFFKITGRHTHIHKPEGKVITFWLAAETEAAALKSCKEKGITGIESIIDDTYTHPWIGEKVK